MAPFNVSTTPDPASASADEVFLWVQVCLSGRKNGMHEAEKVRVGKTLMRLFPALAMALAQQGEPEEAFAAELSVLSGD